MFYTYIIQSLQNNSYYIGSCQDIDERVRLHNHRRVKSTKPYTPWRLVYLEEYKALGGARQRETQLKSWKKRSAIERLIKHSKFNVNRESSTSSVGLS